MQSTDVKAIKKLVAEIDELEGAIQSAIDTGKDKLAQINSGQLRGQPFLAQGAFDQAAWDSYSTDERQQYANQLVQLRDSLKAAAGLDGPEDPDNIMHPAYASNGEMGVVSIAGVVVLCALLASVVWQWEVATATDYPVALKSAFTAMDTLGAAHTKERDANAALQEEQQILDDLQEQRTTAVDKTALATDIGAQGATVESTKVAAETAGEERAKAEENEKKEWKKAMAALKTGGTSEMRVLVMVLLLGAVGGSLHWVTSITNFIGNRNLRRSWILYYASMPFTGAALAAIVYMLLRVGFIAPGREPGDDAGLANIGIYSFAALTGLFSKAATEKLWEVFSTLLQTRQTSRDALPGGRKPPSG